MSTEPIKEEWEKELKRQCEIRNLPFSTIHYLVREILNDVVPAALQKQRKELEDSIRYIKFIVNGYETNKTKIEDIKEYLKVTEGNWINDEVIGASLQDPINPNSEQI